MMSMSVLWCVEIWTSTSLLYCLRVDFYTNKNYNPAFFLLHSEAEVFKEKGNAFYINKAYSEAFSCYSKAIGETITLYSSMPWPACGGSQGSKEPLMLGSWMLSHCNTKHTCNVTSSKSVLLGRDRNNCNWGYFYWGENRWSWGWANWYGSTDVNSWQIMISSVGHWHCTVRVYSLSHDSEFIRCVLLGCLAYEHSVFYCF